MLETVRFEHTALFTFFSVPATYGEVQCCHQLTIPATNIKMLH